MNEETRQLRRGITVVTEDLQRVYESLRTHQRISAATKDPLNALRFELAAQDVKETRQRLQLLLARVAPDVEAIAEKMVPDADALAAAETRPCETSAEDEARLTQGDGEWVV